jgi:hypothetical protein
MVKNKASGAVRCRHHPQARPGGGALPTPSEPRGSYTRKRRDDPADDAPGRPFTARPASPSCNEPPRTRGSVRRATCLFSTDPRPRRQARPRTAPAPTGFASAADLRRRPSGPTRAGGRSSRERPGLPSRSPRPSRQSATVPATDAGRLALGRAATARRLAPPDAIPARQGCIGTRPDAFAYCPKSDANPSSGQPGCRSGITDSCASIPARSTFHRPFVHGIAHRRAPR